MTLLYKAWQLAWAMLIHNSSRLVFTVFGVATAFLLAAAQLGLLVGWTNTNTALITHANADIWLVAEQTPAWDFGTAIPRQLIYKARSVAQVRWTRGLFVAWNNWQRPDGRYVSVSLVGLDSDALGGPWQLLQGDMRVIHRPETIIADELYLPLLQLQRLGDSAQILGNRATLGAISQGIRTFTASPHIFTSIEQALRYDQRYRDDEITYVLVACEKGADIHAVQARLREHIKGVEVLTSREFAKRSASYWMLETGAGITVIITAILGLLVGAVITSQTLFATTQEHLSHYATLLAVGFERRTLANVVILQSLLIGVAGILVGGLLFIPAALASARTPIPLELTPLVLLALIIIFLITCLLASVLSLRSVFKLDAVVVFSQ